MGGHLARSAARWARRCACCGCALTTAASGARLDSGSSWDAAWLLQLDVHAPAALLESLDSPSLEGASPAEDRLLPEVFQVLESLDESAEEALPALGRRGSRAARPSTVARAALHQAAAAAAQEASATEAQKESQRLRSVYQFAFVPLALLTAILAWFTRPRMEKEQVPQTFYGFKWKFLSVWFIAASADWLQGPYLYALYRTYGYDHAAISRLFVVGFGSAGVFGTLAGSCADYWGRKRCAMLYCVSYGLSCLVTHCNDYAALVIGRLLAGVAASLLNSVFECWMVSEHTRRHKFSDRLLNYMFSMMYFVMYLSAVISGILAEWAADLVPFVGVGGGTLYAGGYTAPFDMAFLVLLVALPMIALLWCENDGCNDNTGQSLADSLRASATCVQSNPRISALGCIVLCFEGAMFSFIVNWTPALQTRGAMEPPFGLIFATLMLACMCGASLFNLLEAIIRPTTILLGAALLAALSFAVVAGCVQRGLADQCLIAFLVYEVSVGLYFPAMGAAKSQAVPEESRAGVYALFRFPLNAIVMVLNLISIRVQAAFIVCVTLSCLAAFATGGLIVSAGKEQSRDV